MDKQLQCIRLKDKDGRICFVRNSGWLRLVSEDLARKAPDEIHVDNNTEKLNEVKDMIAKEGRLSVYRLDTEAVGSGEIDLNIPSIEIVPVSKIDFLKEYWLEYLRDEVKSQIETAKSIGVSPSELVASNELDSIGNKSKEITVDLAQECLNFFVDNLGVDLRYENTMKECKTTEALAAYVDIYKYAIKKLKEVKYPLSYEVKDI